MVLEKTLEGPLNSNKMKPLNLKENQSSLEGHTEAEVPGLLPTDVTADSLENNLMLGKTEGKR